MAISIGYGKTYGWDKGALVRLRNTAKTTATGSDGKLTLDYLSPTYSKTFSANITDFTETSDSGSDSAIISAVLNQYSGTAGSATSVWRSGQTVGTAFFYASSTAIVTPATNTATTNAGRSGYQYIVGNPSWYILVNIRSDGTNFDLYSVPDNSWNPTKYDTTHAVDTRYHDF
ncbi:MAG: hypothetical protein WC208_15325, partial [Gallionella sp.]